MPVSRLQAKACTLARAPHAALDSRSAANCSVYNLQSVQRPKAYGEDFHLNICSGICGVNTNPST